MNGIVHLKGFEENTWINGIGDLFCRQGGVRWAVNLSVFPRRQNGADATLLSNAPLLVRKSLINQTKGNYRQSLEKTFTVQRANEWRFDRLGNCPALERRLPNELRQYCFVFELRDGIQVFLPQFELARALFFHNGYLARSSVVHDVLSNEFAVECNEFNKATTIHVLQTCNCPLEMFNDPGYRRLLAWLLLDKNARRSYESISQSQLLYGRDIGQYRRWTFQFEPPPLTNVSLTVKGNFEPVSQTLLVYEVTGIKNIPANVPDQVEFCSPKFYANGNGAGERGQLTSPMPEPMQYNVDDNAEGSRENKPITLNVSNTEFEFAEAVATSRVAKKSRLARGGRKDNGQLENVFTNVSTEEQGPFGTLPSAEWDSLKEQTDDTHLYLNKFKSYFEMLTLLEDRYGCTVGKYPLRKLPALGKCRRHILETDGNRRCLSVALVTIGQLSYYFLEVDTSDAKKALSTKVIFATSIRAITDHLRELEERLLSGSLSWPNKYLDNLVGKKNHFWISHQKSRKSGALTSDEIAKWAERVFSRLR
ncbi:Tn7-like element transposition protein TnsE [Pseudovibrio sp. FO-BEG1]|uniref:Tn7-like element transposition protein TnsE n=1 Tax=Pseudovibrio sp. (strain FO-BEG1) TaxID=911045 RepID=UPI000688D4BB|nr:Tn7-like element transposition protein TnsE [Pseudovibrio sp. FO-BEG1]